MDNITMASAELGDDMDFLSALASFEQADLGIFTGAEFNIVDTSNPGHQAPPPADLSDAHGQAKFKSGIEPKRKRSSIACQACHNKRVRCDAAVSGLPCSNCRFREMPCELIDSKRFRGKRGRYKERNGNTRGTKTVQHASNPPVQVFPQAMQTTAQVVTQPTTQPETQAIAEATAEAETQAAAHTTHNESVNPGFCDFGDDITSPMFDFLHYESSRVGSEARRQSNAEATSQSMHVGERSWLSWLSSRRTKGKATHRSLDNSHLQPGEIVPESVHNSDDVFASPELENSLLDSFWQHFYPLFPIVNKNEIIEAWKLGTVSPLLKQSILFAGAQHSQDSFFANYRYVTKQDAREHFYRAARCLYDRDVEFDRLCITQSMFMLQFHYGPVRGHRDTLWWTGAALNLAQVVGMHRSTKDTDKGPEERRLWKKIWWLLFIRDRQISAGLGKPMMIDERDCDVEDLAMEDFVDGESTETASFVINLMKWAKIVTQVIRCCFTPVDSTNPNKDSKVRIHLALQRWYASLDTNMHYDSGVVACNRFALLLSLCYHELLLLLHRPSFDTAQSSSEFDFSFQMALYAAEKINDLAGDILKHFQTCEFPVYAELIVLSSMIFHSAQQPSSPEEKRMLQKRKQIYSSTIMALDQVFMVLPIWKSLFGEQTAIWRELSGSPSASEPEIENLTTS